ncbi:MAG: HAMP domain-containing histidine kinase [Rhizobiales bacterium]|nr:HAMP domain-containing histidine kinase [Hyphomicrobiales bacterium]
MGLIALDQQHRIDACWGTLVHGLPLGTKATDAMPFLAGLDDVLDDIKEGKRCSLTLPRLALKQGNWTDKVLSLDVALSEDTGGLRILIRDETDLGHLEQKVLQQRNELALANEELAHAKKRAEAALREKASFLANISHDLKTPLQVIIGNAEILRGDLCQEEREAFLQDVLENSNFLLCLMNDLLDASALEANQLKLTEEAVDIKAMLERILSMVRKMPNGRERRFDVRIDDHDQAIMADPMRLQRLLLNIVSNAVKFTDRGGRISVRAGSDHKGNFAIEVEDDGCGIDDDLMKRVFEPFTMGARSDGSGLGLHIAKGLADLHEAKLTLSSEPGVGTTARLCLPRSRIVNSSI